MIYLNIVIYAVYCVYLVHMFTQVPLNIASPYMYILAYDNRGIHMFAPDSVVYSLASVHNIQIKHVHYTLCPFHWI